MSTPTSVIKICSGVRLDNSYTHTIFFSSLANQLSYFAGKVVKTFSAYSFLRKKWSIKVEATMETADGWRYLYFQNTTNGKHYFYFINNVEYVNDSTVELFLEMDVMQTYHFDYEVLPCFVEREHVANDDWEYPTGSLVTDEGLDTGELITSNVYPLDLNDLSILVLSTVKLREDGLPDSVGYGFLHDGIFSGVRLYAIPATNEGITDLRSKFEVLDEKGETDGVIAMWMYPTALLSVEGTNTIEAIRGTSSVDFNIPRPVTLDGYTPRNNKLLTYPYSLLYVSNHSGGGATYKYERFYNDDPLNIQFVLYGCASPEASTKLIPLKYNGANNMNYDEGITGVTFPSCAWDSDTYKLWLAQNQNQLKHQTEQAEIQTAAGAGMVLAGLAGALIAMSTGGAGLALGATAGLATSGLTTAYSGYMQTQSLMAQQKDMKVQPPQARGSAGSSVNLSAKKNTYTAYCKCVSWEQAKALDDYFDLYGYKCNDIKTPNRCVRQNWTYTKTVNCCIKGDLCNEDVVKIANIYNKGVTFWVNGDSIGNYNLTNKTL